MSAYGKRLLAENIVRLFRDPVSERPGNAIVRMCNIAAIGDQKVILICAGDFLAMTWVELAFTNTRQEGLSLIVTTCAQLYIYIYIYIYMASI